MSVIYLDFNRTTPLAPSVLEAMQPYWSMHFMLPGQEHPHAQAVSEALESAREGLASLVGCEPFELVFTAGGTEANNLAIGGVLGRQQPGHLLVSELEHDSVCGVIGSLAGKGWEVETVPCGEDGVVDPDQFQSMIRSDTRLACVQLANPILGTLQPVRELAARCHQRGVLLHCDTTQGFGKIPVDVSHLEVDTAAVSGHKFYGPKGSGAVYVRRGLQLAPIAHGEPREMGLRPGSENVPACIGLGAAASLAARCASDVSTTLLGLRERFANGLLDALPQSARILAVDSPRLPNTLAVVMPCSSRQIQKSARQLALATPRSTSPPDPMTRALRAIGCSESEIGRTLAISLGWTTSQQQVDRAVELLADACDAAIAS